VLSNGWTPTFQGRDACALSFRYTQCGGLYRNPVIPTDCPDPGVIFDGTQYVLTCTSGNAANAFPIYTSPDLVNWTLQGSIFPAGRWPSWARSNFWAAEIHRVGSQYVAYYSASDSGGVHRVGSATAPTSTGPFTDLGTPLVEDATEGVIDPTEFTDLNGTPYVIWKVDGNANGKPTPILGQKLSPDGLALVGAPTQLITNDLPWEGAVTEAPYLVLQGGTYYLFYSGNSYATPSYAVGVASAPSPLGPYTKNQRPILVTDGAWAGPGHCAVVETPAGDSYMVYHSWVSGCVNAPGCGRELLVDALLWGGAYPSVPLAPSSNTRPMP
jgi:beta-xylosidase